MENLDTDIPPPAAAVEATRAAVGTDEANSWLPFTGMSELKHEVARMIVRRGGPRYDPEGEVVITSGEGDNMLDALLALTDPGDEVIVPDPTYAGMLQRVRLVGGVPRLVPLHPEPQGWRWDLDALEAAVSDRTRAIFFGNPSFPSGWVVDDDEWAAVQRICTERQIWLLYWSAMEAIVFGGRKVVVPAALEGMRDLTVTLGGVACEQRMIGWRIGWIVASQAVTPQLGMIHIYNGLVASGFNQLGAIAALRADDHMAGVAEWERRHDVTMEQLAGLPATPPPRGLVAAARCRGRGHHSARLLCRVARAQGRRHTDDRLGRDRRPALRALRLLQRARREARSAGRARARRAQLIHHRRALRHATALERCRD